MTKEGCTNDWKWMGSGWIAKRTMRHEGCPTNWKWEKNPGVAAALKRTKDEMVPNPHFNPCHAGQVTSRHLQVPTSAPRGVVMYLYCHVRLTVYHYFQTKAKQVFYTNC